MAKRNMSKPISAYFTRRNFIKTSGIATGGLILGVHVTACSTILKKGGPALKPGQNFAPNCFLRIGPEEEIRILIGSSEMGQGVVTSLPMLVAEELEISVDKITVEVAPVAEVYNNKTYGMQSTGGSSSIRGFWHSMRLAGASAREMLIQAAAKEWDVSASGCEARGGRIYHMESKRSKSFGELAQSASRLPLPDESMLKLKSSGEFELIGKSVARIDIPSKTDGSAQFGSDIKVPNMAIAVVARGTYSSFDSSETLKSKGVSQVIPIMSGIAVVADTTWHAMNGKRKLKVEWNRAPIDSEKILAECRDMVKGPGNGIESRGNVTNAFATSGRQIDVIYQTPFLAHATMEPMNCVADVTEDRAHIYVGTQSPQIARAEVAQRLGFSYDQVFIHVAHLGGGFGRRSETDFSVEAAELSQKLNQPVKIVWDREDDMQNDFYRPFSYHRVRGALDLSGRLAAWNHHLVGPSIVERVSQSWITIYLPEWIPGFMAKASGKIASFFLSGNGDPTTVEGIKGLPYNVPHFKFQLSPIESGIPIGFWRSVGHSNNAFVVESFVDEMSVLAETDPYLFRRDLLKEHPRLLGVLDLAAKESNWTSQPSKNHYRGIAVHKSFESYVAQVAEISVKQGVVMVEKITCAIDCGQVVHPDTVKAQMESGIVYGMTAALMGQISVKEGKVEQTNFHDYPLLRMNQMPRIDVHILPSTEHPGGVGEPGTPPIAPALGNAIYAATGKRLRTLPFSSEKSLTFV